MPIFRFLGLLAAALLLGAPSLPAASVSPVPQSDWPAQGATLSVMTYNVAGLPWPAGRNRQPALAAIAGRLGQMRARGVQPHVVLLQEAFVDEAKRIGQIAGYRYAAFGPARADRSARPPMGRAFAAGAQWLKGERSGTLVDSGLVILSDYPIARTKRRAFPQGACAGFDCLAAKGVLAAWIDVPGTDQPLVVVDTHLNSRRASGASIGRANAANVWQVAAIRDFLSSGIAPESPVILGGDMNIGQDAKRRAAFAVRPLIGPGQTDGLAAALAHGTAMAGSRDEARRIAARNKDMILSRNGSRLDLTPARSWVPFKMATIANPLSDHAGYVVDYEVVDLKGPSRRIGSRRSLEN